MSRILAFFCAFLICFTAQRALAEPAMWVVTDDDSTVYLLGTIHFLPPDLHWQSDKFRAAFEASSELWLEAELGDDAAMLPLVRKYGIGKEPLSRKLSVLERRQLGAAAKALGLQQAVLQPLRPWLAALTLVTATAMKAGMSPDSGVDRQLQDAAKITGKTLRGLETMEQQIRMLSEMSPATELDMLRQTLVDIVEGEAYVTELVKAWHDGDLAMMESAINSTMREQMPALYDILILDRNKDWVQQIETLMAGAGTIFIGVGAGHMTGEDGVPTLLSQRGYTVARY